MKADLNPRHAEFIRQYFLLNRNATAAYRVVYPKCKTPEINASQLLRNPKVLNEISRREARVEEAFILSQDKIVSELVAIAFGHAGKVMDWSAESMTFVPKEEMTENDMKFIESISQESYSGENGGSDKISMKTMAAQKVKALELLGKHIGMWSKSNDKDPESGSGKDPATDAIGRAVEIINGRIRRRSKKADSDSQDGE